MGAHPSSEGRRLGVRPTVLLVEDDAHLRLAVGRTLRQRGCDVLEASDAEAALDIAASHEGKIDLLLTDVVLASMDGRQLAERVVAARPEVKVLFTSDQLDDVTGDDLVTDAGPAFIAKPFSAESLGRKVREVLRKTSGVYPVPR